tara:strand:+ start:273 stop:1292 length:1020 start_codon:yes stop_codon:yes gene_type:complete
MFKSIFSLILVIGSSWSLANEVNIYTSRHYDSDDKLYEDFRKETGIKINVISGNGSALLERLKTEGANSPADIFFTVDAGNLWKIQKEEYFQNITSSKILSIVPKNLRGPNNEWIAIAKRARVIFYNPNNVSKEEIQNLRYENLADKEWRDRIVIRSSNNIYNQSLVASLISTHGINTTESWAKGLVSNFARKPQGNDRSQIMAVANGIADIAIANSYYYGYMLSGKAGEDQQKAAQRVKMFFPNQNDRGVHINISGLGVLKNAKNVDNAYKFIEFLLSRKMQESMVNNSFEYPVVKNVLPHPDIASSGLDFLEDEISVSEYGKFNSEALKLMDRAGWK